MNVKSERLCSNDLIRNAQLDVANELRKQQIEIKRIDTVLSFLKEMESNESEQDLLDEPYKFRGLREVREELDQYTALVQRVMYLTRRNHSNYSKHKYVNDNFVGKAHDNCNIRTGFGYHNTVASTASTDNFVEKARSDCNIHTGLGYHNTATSTTSSQHSRMNHLAITATTTEHFSPELGNALPKCCCGNSSHNKPKEVLVDARQSVQNHRVLSSSEPGSLMQLVQPTTNTNQKPYPFLSQTGPDSHSMHAAVQTVLSSLKRTLPGFHPTASTILKSDVVDFIAAFAVALRRYDDRIRSQMILLFEEYDSLVSSAKRSELSCKIDHLYKVSRSASSKREQLLDILHGPYYQAVNCPPLRQMKILHATFSSNSL
ncbi:unnamed protein product [Onchocerca ochengi]|uniref:Lzipper-MIP1 domain-containing protein n=1 Tax=Onchocerca ochengi TaxID=42157 RepID=A0A182EJS7_ONCOC|nr:unnamed protein product [Onchocerca ochengi]